MGWLIAIGVLAVGVLGLWLLETICDGAAEIALAAALWPFHKLTGVARSNHALSVVRTVQRFQLSAAPAQVAGTLASLPAVQPAPPDIGAGPFLIHAGDRRVVIGVGCQTSVPHEIEVTFAGGWPGTCGELRHVRHPADPSGDLAVLHDVHDTVFRALASLDPQPFVTTGALTPGPATEGRPATPAPFGPAPGGAPTAATAQGPAWPHARVSGAQALARNVPAIPAVGLGLFAFALIVAGCTASGVLHSTSEEELCNAYATAAGQFGSSSFSTDEGFDEALDNVDMTDELTDLKRRAEHYDDDGVHDDADAIDDIDGMFSKSDFDSATTHIAAIC